MESNKKEYCELRLSSLLWKGENLNGKVILILSEQGLGDIIQFARYVYELQERYDVKIIFRTHNKLIHLFKNDKFQIISEKEKIPIHDYYVYLMSLPKFFFQREQQLLKQYNFINKNNAIFFKWKNIFSQIKTPRIGINWQGDNNFKGDKIRSIPLIHFEPLFNVRGLEYINLQKGFGLEQIDNFKYKKKIHNFSSLMDSGRNSFEDTIEIIRNLDLVITSCTAIAHLSSTIGVKTWILLSYSPDWRWFLNNDSTPWYKNTRLYRQKKEGDWSQILDEVKNSLIKEFSI